MLLNNEYEISVWRDDLSGDKKEVKLATIGSNQMTSYARAREPKLVENINGTNTFSFKMFLKYYDENGIKVDNPFIKLLVNERIVKLKWKNEWYDFVIKSRQESSDGKSVEFTCKDLFINELSKNGFELVFDNELMNNQGSIVEIAEQVLKDTAWSVDKNKSEKFEEIQEKALLKLTLANDLVAYKYDLIEAPQENNITIEAGKSIYIPYLDWTNETNLEKRIDFLYVDSETLDSSYDEDILTNTHQYWNTIETIRAALPQIIEESIYNKTGYFRVLHQQMTFDSRLGMAVGVYKTSEKENNIYYGYDKTVFESPITVKNIIPNSENFVNANGWSATFEGESVPIKPVPITQVMGIRGKIYDSWDFSQAEDNNVKSFLDCRVSGDDNKGTLILKSNVSSSLGLLQEGLIIGQKYICNLIVGHLTWEWLAPEGSYKIGVKGNDGISYLEYESNKVTEENWGRVFTLTCENSLTPEEVKNKDLYFYLELRNDTAGAAGFGISIESVQLFKLVPKDTETYLTPNDILVDSISKVYRRYYNVKENEDIVNPEDIKYQYEGEDTQENIYVPQLIFDKTRSISIKQSNRFNILQKLSETFEGWVHFDISHDDNGYITGRKIYFTNEVGKETGLGFRYGLDLKNITRSIDSEQIASKIIVKQNSNEFGKNGFCTITRAKDNLSKEDYILDFGYYVNHQLINGDALNNFLYVNGIVEEKPRKGFYQYVREINIKTENNNILLSEYNMELIHNKTNLSLYENYLSSAKDELANIEERMLNITNKSAINDALDILKQRAKDSDVTAQSLLKNYYTVKNSIETYKNYIGQSIIMDSDGNIIGEGLIGNIAKLEQKIKELIDANNDLSRKKSDAILKLNEKLGRFIQEGTWNSDDYYDDDKYYIDAVKVARTSSRPKVSYTINTISLSALPEYSGRVFHKGDISYVQDEDFFGYDSNGNPIKEKIILTEIISNLDSPENDTYKVQNYRTQFEDLFQRITATSQTLQFNGGSYERAANILNPNGTINTNVMQDSINQNLIIAAQNDLVTYGNTGLDSTDQINNNYKTRVNSRGLFISQDGGKTWITAVRGEDGVATNLLSAGTINTDKIIIQGADNYFRWDNIGIQAYDPNDITNFTRHDKFGFYGFMGNNKFDINKKIDKIDTIKKYANFYLTHSGAGIKGEIVATSGEIGGWKIDGNKLISKETNSNGYTYGIGLNVGAVGNSEKIAFAIGYMQNDEANSWWNTAFKVTGDGKLYATAGNIGGWDIHQYYLVKTNKDTGKGVGLNMGPFGSSTTVGSTVFAIGSGVGTTGGWDNAEFRVTGDGKLHAKGATIEGTVTATTGSIGGWKIYENSLETLKGNWYWYDDSKTAIYYRQYGVGINLINLNSDAPVFAIGQLTDGIPAPDWEISPDDDPPSNYRNAAFWIDGWGKLYATGAVISGELKAATGTFTGELKAATGTFTGNLTASSTQFTRLYIDADNYIEKDNVKFGAGFATIKLENFASKGVVQISAGTGTAAPIISIDSSLSYGQLKGNWVYETLSPTNSDANLKNSIISVSTNYDTLFDNLTPRLYKYNDGTSNRIHTGLIAQEVKSALDKANISTSDFAGYVEIKDDTMEDGIRRTLRYGEFIALCIDQIQKLKKRVAELENK